MSEHTAENDATIYSGLRTKPNPDQPDRCPSIDPHDTLQCGRRIHNDDQCQFGGIAWKKGTRPPHERRHPWGSLEAALVATLADWRVECDARPTSGEGSDCSDLMDVALTRIKGLCSKALDPEDVMAEIERVTADYDAHGLRKCFPKTGWLSAERYCAVHGRGAGWPCKIGTSARVTPPESTAEKDARSSHIEHITSELLLTDALTGNDEGTPTHYTVPADDVEYLVRTVLDLASQIHEERIAELARVIPPDPAADTEETP